MNRWIVLGALMVSACVPQAKYNALETSYADAQSRIEKLQGRVRESESAAKARFESFRDLRQALKPLLDEGLAKFEVRDGLPVLTLGSDLLFAPGSAELGADGNAALARIAPILKATDAQFQVNGHTDSSPISTPQFPNNWALGAARAITVTQALIAAGLPGKKVAAASYGDTSPVETNETSDGRAQNRRIDIAVIPDFRQLPGYQELTEAGARKRERQ